MALHGICSDLLHTYLVQLALSGTASTKSVTTVAVLPYSCHIGWHYPVQVFTYRFDACKASRHCMGSVWTCCTHIWSNWGHQEWQRAPRSQSVSHSNLTHILFCNILVTWCDTILCKTFHTDSRHPRHCLGSVWTYCTHIWSNRGQPGMAKTS